MSNDGALIINPNGKARVIESSKSFKYKLSLKNPDGSPTYESADFFHNCTYQCDPEDAKAAAREARDICVAEVTEDIRVFQEQRKRKQPHIAGRTA